MTEAAQPPEKTTRKRRTPEEVRAFLNEQLKNLEAREKAEVLRLLSDAHDTIKEAAALQAAKPLVLAPALAALDTAIKAVTPKP